MVILYFVILLSNQKHDSSNLYFSRFAFNRINMDCTSIHKRKRSHEKAKENLGRYRKLLLIIQN